MFTMVKTLKPACPSARLAIFEGTIVDAEPLSDRTALDNTPRQRITNRGGGYAEDVEVVPAANGHLLLLDGPASVVTQVRLTDARYTSSWARGRHQLLGGGPGPTQATNKLLELLGEVLSLRCGPQLDFALAVDWYKSPIDGVDSKDWPNTATGELVHRGKYWYKTAVQSAKLRACGRALVERLVPVVRRHPLLEHVDAVVAVPGHDAKVVNFGGRLAHAVALELPKPFVRCGAVAEFRPQAKALDLAKRAAMIDGQFVCTERLDGQSVLIVDDVFGSGSTAEETARALRAAGAARVACLCAVRTMRS
jgi:adenine/guanine phosphoribosyltransferase-like PRPP-binding protein